MSHISANIIAVRRFSVTAALDTAIRLYRGNFWTLVLISAVVAVPGLLMGGLAIVGLGRLESLADAGEGAILRTALLFLSGFAGIAVMALIVATFGMAASTRVASVAALGGPPSLEDALGAAIKIWWPLLSAIVLTSLLAFGAGFLMLVPAVAYFVTVGDPSPQVFAVAAICLLGALIATVNVHLGLVFVAPVVVTEQASGAPSLGRSWRLARGRRGKILAVLMLVMVLMGIGQLGAELCSTLLVAATSLEQQSTASLIVSAMLQQGVSVLVMPIWYVTIVLLYYDARVDQEAFDVQTLARAAG